MANFVNPKDPMMGKAAMTFRRASENLLVVFGTVMMAPESIDRLPKEIESTGLIIIGNMGFKVDLAAIGPPEWAGMTHSQVMTTPLNLRACEVIEDPITSKIACLDNLQFCDITEMFRAIEGK